MSPKKFFIFFIFFIVSCWSISSGAKRQKRELRFPKGASFVAAVALTSLLPKGVTDGIVHVLEFDLGFPFPEKILIDKVEKKKKYYPKLVPNYHYVDTHFKKKYRVKKSLKETQKQNIITSIENAISRFGYNGSACVKRLQCELQQTISSNTLIEDLVEAIFKTPLEHTKVVCEEATRTCPFSLLHILFHSEQIEPH